MTDIGSHSRTLVDVLRLRAEHQPGRRAYTFLIDGEKEGDRFSFGELDTAVAAVAARLQQLGAAGERALLLYPAQGSEFLVAFYACLYAGVVAIPAPPPDAARLKRSLPRLATIVSDARAAFVLGTTEMLGMLDQVDDSLPTLAALRRVDTGRVPAERAADYAPTQLDAEALAYLQYTSGSTSTPKGVMIAHRHLMENLAYNRVRWGYDSDSAAASWMPYFHDFGLVEGLMQPAYSGVPAHILSPLAFLRRPRRWLDAITRYRITHSAAPNFGYDQCVDRIPPKQREGLDLSTWRMASCGAEVIRAETLRRFAEAFGPQGFSMDTFYPSYGLAEATLLVTTRRHGEAPRILDLDGTELEEGRVVPVQETTPAAGATAPAPDSATLRTVVGSGVDSSIAAGALDAHRDETALYTPVEVAIVEVGEDGVGTRLESDRVGEVWISSGANAAGYWERPEATAETFNARVRAADGSFDERSWLISGDLGFLHGGELFISGRAKDLIIIRGSNHFPQDLELTAEVAHPLLRTNCCAAVSVEAGGEERLVLAAEVERSFREEQLDTVVGALRQAIAEAHDVEIWAVRLLRRGSILKTSSGKIQRRAMRQAFLDDELEVMGAFTLPLPGERSTGAAAGAAGGVVSGEDTPTGPGAEVIEAWIAERLGRRYGLAPEQVDRQQPFARYGMDSAAAVALVGELEEFLERRLPETLLYEHPNVRAVARHLAGAPVASTPDSTIGPAADSVTGPRGAATASTHTVGLNEPIAIVGLGCRFPGAESPQAFWELLAGAVDAVTETPADRWDVDALYDPEPQTTGKMSTRWGGYLDRVDLFDAEFFGVSPREAARMDPQQRLLLEVVWEALEHARTVPEGLAGSDTGVFVGISTNDYRRLQHGALDRLDAYAGTGNALSIAANRLSYLLDLRGPSVAVDTACSSSLVALHQACQALRSGECSTAIAAGVNVMLAPEWTVTFSQANMMAADGRCKTFDSRADGYVRGEGCGAVVLKRLSDARAAGDKVLAVVSGSAVNQDGRSNGLTAPNGGAQEAVIRGALARAGVTPRQVGYVEAHGTGTALGDPIEVRALAAVLGEGRDAAAEPVLLGSVKTNIGHLESAAGIAGLIKTVLALEHERIPRHLHFQEPNPRLDWDDLPVRVSADGAPWPRGEEPRVAGISSFGFGGTNAHVVVADAPRVSGGAAPGEITPAGAGADDSASAPDSVPDSPRLPMIPLSARTPAALDQLVGRWVQRLATADDEASVQDFGAASVFSRTTFDHRLTVVANSIAEARSRLAAAAAAGSGPPRPLGLAEASDVSGVVRGARRGGAPKIAFLYTGQGVQDNAMGAQLHRAEPVFREALDRCAAVLDGHLGYSLQTVLYGDGWEGELLHQTAYTQPAVFAVEWALTALWESWGIVPDAVAGTGVGEIVAACVAGVLRLEDGLQLVVQRARLMQELPAGGTVLAVFAAEERVLEVLETLAQIPSASLPPETAGDGTDGEIAGPEIPELAAVYGPSAVALAGTVEAIQRARYALEDAGVETRALKVSHAFQSHLMEPALAQLRQVVDGLEHRSPRLPLISSLSGQLFSDGEGPGPEYWPRQARRTVRFGAGVRALAELGCTAFVEIGPHRDLLDEARTCLPPGHGTWVPSLEHRQDDHRVMAASLGTLWSAGAEVDWRAVFGPHGERHGRALELPMTPFQRERHWLDYEPAVPVPVPSRVAAGARPWLDTAGAPRRPEGEDGTLRWTLPVSVAAFPFLDDHRVQGAVVVPAAAYLELLLEVVEERFDGERPPRLVDVAVHRAFFVPDDGEVPLHLTFTPGPVGDGEGARFTLRFGTDGGVTDDGGTDDGGADGGEDDGLLCCSGSVTFTELARSAAGDSPASTDSLEPPSWESPRFGAAVAGDRYYRDLKALGLDYGPAHRGIVEIRSGQGEAISRIEVPSSIAAEVASYRLHPAILDAAWQTLAAAIPTHYTADGGRVPWLPVALEGFVLHRRPGGAVVCHARLLPAATADGHRLRGDVLLVDADGRGVAECRGLTVQRIERAGTRRRQASLTLDQLCWVEEPRSTTAPGVVPEQGVSAIPDRNLQHRPWLVFCERRGVGQALINALRERGEPCVEVRAGLAYERLDDDLASVRPGRGKDLDRLLAETAPAGIRGAVLLWSADGRRPINGPTNPAASRGSDLAAGFATARGLAQALLASSAPAPLWLVTRGAQAVAGDRVRGEAVNQSTLWGFGRTLEQEQPALFGGLADLDPEAADVVAEAAALFAELVSESESGGDPGPQVGWRGGRRYALRLESVEPPPVAGPVTLRPEVAYLITGGLGDLGIATARWMVERGARQLILASRSPLPSREHWSTLDETSKVGRRVASVRALESAGATVHTVALDIADEGAVTNYLEAWAEAGGAVVRGVIHAAGTVDLVPLEDLDNDAVEAVLRPKVQGSLALHRAFEGIGLDFFVLFSSISAVLGSPQLAHYAAANAFLDALATWRRGRGLPALSIGWPAWEGLGMAHRRGVERPQGMAAFDEAAGLRLLDRLLAAPGAVPPAVACLPVDWAVWARAYPRAAAAAHLRHRVAAKPIANGATSISPSASPASAAVSSQAAARIVEGSTAPDAGDATVVVAAAVPARSREELVEWISARVGEVLDMDPQRIEEHRSLNSLGLDSLMAVEIKNAVEDDLGVTFSVVDLLRGPSVGELADRVVAQGAASSAPDPALATASAPALAAAPASAPASPEHTSQSSSGSPAAAAPARPALDEWLQPGREDELIRRLGTLSDQQVQAALDRLMAEASLEEMAS